MLELEIHPTIVLVIAGRDPLERSTAAGPKHWLPYYETHTLYALPLHEFTHEETAVYLAERGITGSERVETIWQLSHGLPLYLGLLVSTTQGTLDPTKDVVDNFLHRIPDSEPKKRQLALDVALFSRPFTLDDLEAFPYLTNQEHPTLSEWLLRQPFVRASSLTGRFVYHDVVQELFQRYLLHYASKTYYATRRALATYYRQQLEYLQTVQDKNRQRPSDEQMEVTVALVLQLLLLPDEKYHLQALSSLFEVFVAIDFVSSEVEKAQKLYSLLKNSVETSPLLQTGSYAHQVAQLFLHFMETYPTEYNQSRKQAWFQVTGDLLTLTRHSSSSELLAHISCSCGWAYFILAEYQQSLTFLERAIEIQPSYAPTYEVLGHVYRYLKKYQQAVDICNQGLQFAPYRSSFYFTRGVAYIGLKAYDQARNDINRCLQVEGNNATASVVMCYIHLGRIYMKLKDYQKALAEWDRAIKVNPENPWTGRVQFRRGCAFLLLKNLPQAVICFTHSYELASTQGFFSWSQDFILWAREWSAMCQMYPDPQTQQLLRTIAGEEHYLASVCRGVFFFLQKEFELALIELQHAATSQYDPVWQHYWADYWREWDAHFWLAMVYVALDQEEEARGAIALALAFEMPPILLKPLTWFEQEKPELYGQWVKPLLATYGVE